MFWKGRCSSLEVCWGRPRTSDLEVEVLTKSIPTNYQKDWDEPNRLSKDKIIFKFEFGTLCDVMIWLLESQTFEILIKEGDFYSL